MERCAAALYEPLSAAKNQIRLMKLKSELCADQIHCLLEVFDIETAPKYRALSYAWGPKDLRQIRLNGQDFPIRINLFDFFQVLQNREAYHSEWLWIDQICINQESIPERNQQVSIMDQIYRGAHETVVWLGPNPDAQLLERLLATTWGEEGSVSPFEWEAFNKSCAVPYWSRHWIVQELLLSQTHTIWYGTCAMSWETYSHWAQGCQLDHASTTAQKYLPKPFFMLDYIRAKTDDSDFERWVGVVVHGALSLCEDPRDKVYGIQSWCHPSLRLEVDYAMPTEQVYRGAIEKCKTFLVAKELQVRWSLNGEPQEFMRAPRYAIREFCRACFALAAAMALPVTPNLMELIREQVVAVLEACPSFRDYHTTVGHDRNISGFMAAWVQEIICDGEQTGAYPMSRKGELIMT